MRPGARESQQHFRESPTFSRWSLLRHGTWVCVCFVHALVGILLWKSSVVRTGASCGARQDTPCRGIAIHRGQPRAGIFRASRLYERAGLNRVLPQAPTDDDDDDDDDDDPGPPANRQGRAPMRASAANISTPQMRWGAVAEGGGESGGGAEERKKDAGVSSHDKMDKFILDEAKKKRKRQERQEKEVRPSK